MWFNTSVVISILYYYYDIFPLYNQSLATFHVAKLFYFYKEVIVVGEVKARQYVFYSRWDKHELKCACLFGNPCCDRYRQCEEIELKLKPYEDVESCMNKARKYKRHKGAIRQE